LEFCFSDFFDTESCRATFHSIFTDTLDIFVPKICPKVTRHKGKPNRYYPRYIRDLIKDKAIDWKRWRVSRNECDKLKYKSVANKCIQALNKYHAAKELQLIRKNNLGSFYNFINKKLKTNTFINTIRSPGDLITNSKYQTSIFNNYFASVFTNDDGVRPTPSINPRVGTQNTFIDSVEFTSECVFNALKHLKPTTSSGPDGIPNICLKYCASVLAVSLCHIFDSSFKNGVIPVSWKTAYVLPIHKKGCTSDPCNYRPISL